MAYLGRTFTGWSNVPHRRGAETALCTTAKSMSERYKWVMGGGAARIKFEIDMWAKVIRAANIKAQ
jgi:hypothetical protein